MELRHLRYFIAVADELSFSHAAERLGIAQPPLSQQIQALEAELNVQLFDRKKRPLQLTPPGSAFLAEARLMLKTLEQAVSKTQRIQQGELGCLTIGFTSAMANGILPNILRSFRQQYPEVKLILSEENSSAQIQRLRDRVTDIMFFYQDCDLFEAKDLVVMPLLQESLVAILPQHHFLTAQSTISLVDLKSEKFIMPDRQVVPGLSKQIYQLCHQAGFVPEVAQEAIFMVTILGLVAGEIGISILPSSVQNLQRTGVVYRSISEQTTTNQLTAIWQRDNLSTILPQFINILKTCG